MTHKISISSIILGQLVDKALFISLVVFLVYFLDESTLLFSITAILAGSICTFTGSLYAANRAKHWFLLHALLVAAITFALSFARFVVTTLRGEPSVHPLWWEFTAWSATLVSGYLGGIYAQMNSRGNA